jgi:hypothetical protein
MQTETEPKTKGATWRKWLLSVLSMVLGTALVYWLTAQWPADDYADRVVQLLLVLVLLVVAPFAIGLFIRKKVWPRARRYEWVGGHLVRTHLSTGEREILKARGWTPLGAERRATL